MKAKYMFLKSSVNLWFSFVFLIMLCLSNAVAGDGYGDAPIIKTSAKDGMCNIIVDNKIVDNFKCIGGRDPLLISYSNLYEMDEEIIVIIELPLGNACDGGPIHVLGKDYGSEYKVIKVIDFCGGKFPKIITGPSTFSINIDSVDIEGTNETIPAEKWEFKDNTIVKVK